MTYDEAIELMKQGKKIRCEWWHPSLYIVFDSEIFPKYARAFSDHTPEGCYYLLDRREDIADTTWKVIE